MLTLWLRLVIFFFPGTRCEEAKSTYRLHCCGYGVPLQLSDPFDPGGKEGESFIRLTWLFSQQAQDGTTLESELVVIDRDRVISRSGRYAVFHTLGLQVLNVTEHDSGLYSAVLLTDRQKRTRTVDVLVAVPPVLNTSHLQISREKTISGMTLTCGRMDDLGIPPVQLQWRALNGTTFRSQITQNELSINISSQEDATGFICELDKSSSPATECIFRRSRWRARWADSMAYTRVRLRHVGTHNSHTVYATLAVVTVVSAIGGFFYIKMFRKKVYMTHSRRAKPQQGINSIDVDQASQALSHTPSMVSEVFSCDYLPEGRMNQ